MEFKASHYLSEQGPFAQEVSGFTVRQAQVELANAIEQAMQSHAILVAEAGTGTGKTWSYLVPAFLETGKVIISTGTRNLQDQILRKDIPQVSEVMRLPSTAVVLKGRSNYVCHHYLQQLEQSDRGLRSKEEVPLLRAIRTFTDRSPTGDKADCVGVPEGHELWYRVTSTRESCLGKDCNFYNDCFVLKARERAKEADIVIINHALFFADLALKQEGVAELLPQAAAVIFDEAHLLPDNATRFLGEMVNGEDVPVWTRKATVVIRNYLKDSVQGLEALVDKTVTSYRNLSLQWHSIEERHSRQALVQHIEDFEAIMVHFDELTQALERAVKALMAQQERHVDVAAVVREGAAIYDGFMRWAKSCPPRAKAQEQGTQGQGSESGGESNRIAVSAAEGSSGQAETLKSVAVEGNELARVAVSPEARDDLSQLVAESQGVEHEAVEQPQKTTYVCWVQLTDKGFRLHRAPLSVSHFASFKRPEQAWVMTSATLSVGGDFKHFVNRLGLNQATQLSWDSPFNYNQQGVMYVPDLPLPSDWHFAERFIETLVPLIRATHGGVLVLCTSLRAVEDYGERLADAFSDEGIERPILLQGEASRAQLMARFRELGQAVLIGSASFWEGVDFPGDLLTLVAIDKLPFQSPDDPILEARVTACEARGRSPFVELQLPHAAIALKQGAGRLIRSEKDAGVLMIGDVRLVQKGYGKTLWRALPDFYRTREQAVAVDFLRYLAGEDG